MRFENKIVLVIGGGGGIGSAIVRRFAQEGATVVSSDVFPEKAQEIVEEARAKGGKAEFLLCRANEEKEVEALIAAIVEKYGRLDCAVNAMGGVVGSPYITETPAERYHEIIESNLTSFFYAMKHEGRQMVKQKSGAIVNISSLNAFVMNPQLGNYSAAKAGCTMMSKTMAMEVGPEGVRVNTISPGYTATPPVIAGLSGNPELLGEVLYKTPTRKLSQPEDIAAAAAFLCSDDAGNITAHDLVVDGGESTEGYPDTFEIRTGRPRAYVPGGHTCLRKN